MNPVTPLGASPTTASDSAATSSATSSLGTSGSLLDPNEFMNLLIAQLKYQDPLDPTNSADFMSQLAALSQVQTEQQVAQSDSTSAAASLIGTTVSGSDESGAPVTGVVTGFQLVSGSPVLTVGDDSVALTSVTAVESSSSTTSNPTG